MITEKVIQYFHKCAHDHHRHHASPNLMKKIDPIIFIECPLKLTHSPIGYRYMDDLL